MEIELKKYGKTLGLRKLGNELKALIINNINNNDKVAIDFQGIELLSNSFTDELIAKLYAEIGKDKFKEFIALKNTSPDTKKMIMYGINERIHNPA